MLQWLVDSIVKSLLSWMIKFGILKVKEHKRDDAIFNDEKRKAEKLKKAKTDKEVEDAARDTLSNL
jgi:hypothetical protein